MNWHFWVKIAWMAQQIACCSHTCDHPYRAVLLTMILFLTRNLTTGCASGAGFLTLGRE